MQRAARPTMIGVLWAAMASCATGEMAHYFEDCSTLTVPPEGSCLEVVFVFTNMPAQHAGIKAGDRVVAVDQQRVRSVAEFNFLQRMADQRDDIQLTLVRDGKLVTLVLRDLWPIRRVGVDMAEKCTYTVKPDSGWQPTWVDIFGAEPPRLGNVETNGPVADVMDAFGVDAKGVMPWVDPFMEGRFIPARASEAIARLAVRNDARDLEWVLHLLRVRAALLCERRDEAMARISEHKLLDRKVDPFLDRLLLFYRDVMSHPVTAAGGVRLDQYQVDAPFFALCYPYPVIPAADTNTTGCDAAFEELLVKMTSGRPMFKAEATRRAASLYRDRTGETAAKSEQFFGQVMRAVLDPDNNGGFPWRSALVYDAEPRRQMLAALHQRLNADAAHRGQIALCLLGPAVVDSDEEAFREGYAAACDAGYRVAACAGEIIDNTLKYARLDRPALTRIRQEIEDQHPLPEFYRYLRTISPMFAKRLARGRYVRYGNTFVQTPSYYCHVFPHVVAKALQQPLDPNQIANMVRDGAASGKPEDRTRAVALAAYDAAASPSAAKFDALLRLHTQAGAGPVCEALGRVLVYDTVHEEGLQNDVATRKCREFFSSVETRHYQRIAMALDKTGNADPALNATIAQLYQEAGVPSVCLLLARKLRQAGRPDDARRYIEKARGFHFALRDAYGNSIDPSVACRDFASISGMEEYAAPYTAEIEKRPTDAGRVLMAVVASYRGDTEGAVRNLIASVEPKLATLEGPFLYEGANYYSVQFLRMQLLTDLLTQKKLTDEQIARLNGVAALQTKTIIDSL